MKQRLLLLVSVSLSLLVSCTEVNLEEPQLTPEIVTIAVDPAVGPVRDAIQVCSDLNPQLAVVPQEVSPAYEEWSAFDLFIRLGEPPEMPAFVAPLAVEQVGVVVNPANPLTDLTSEELEAIFSGHLTRWSELNGSFRPIQVWVYPEGDVLNQVLIDAIMPGKTITGHANLAPDPSAMIEAISADPDSIGILPGAWLNGQIHLLEIDSQTKQRMQLPVLAIAKSEPVGAKAGLVHCLQQGEGLVEVQRIYQE